MSGHVRGAEQCHLCGRPLVDARCPVCDASPRYSKVGATTWLRLHDSRPALIVLAGAAIAVAGYLTWLALPGPSAPTAPSTRTDRPPVASTPPATGNVVVPDRLGSVFGLAGDTIDEFGHHAVIGYAFVVSSRHGVSRLLTDYHLVAAAYLHGETTVNLVSGGALYSATIVRVSPDPHHVALLQLSGTWPPLPISRAAPATGEPVILGAFTGQARERTALIVYSGPGGDTHLTFAVPVPAGGDGAPVLDAAGRVLGIAESTDEFGPAATGVGFAVPIRGACAEVSAC